MSASSPSRPMRVSDVPKWDIRTDVVVVGFGAAGLCAAIEARTLGVAVEAFEVASSYGGSAALSGGELYLGGGGGTPVQRAAGFEDSTEDLFSYLVAAGGPGADLDRARLYAEQALDHFSWLCEQGVPFKGSYLPGKWLEPLTDDTLTWSGNEEAWPCSELAKPAPRGHAPQMAGWGAGRLLVDSLARRAVSLGTRVHYDSRVTSLIADEHNAVHGIAVRMDGELRCVLARHGVILCAGGFVCNEGMLKQYAPSTALCRTPITAGNDHGAGIRMGISVGAAAIHMEQFFCTMPFYPPESLVKGIFVNERGQRFINEDSYHGRVTQEVLRQPNARAWLLVDNEIFDRPIINPKIVIAAVGDTWAELEQELRLLPGSLVQTVQQFNDFARAGRDPVLHKAAPWLRALSSPPFAALSFCANEYDALFFTLGGLSTLPTGQVLAPDGSVIPGLFAAGRTACGLPRWGDGYASGLSLGDSTFFGRRAGRSAAACSVSGAMPAH
ncbi:MAG: FAD-dependent oxidoreductase [Proteobacteria bacterium]|nr:FAD-dependent oxidoreductase [Pseudomonadota bacterium]